jgi:glycosyltransferase involved in cell wall biosynthesis
MSKPTAEPDGGPGGARVSVGIADGWPSVTVVVPTHDRPELMARAVRSILEQEYPGEIECIVVFDKAEPVPVPVRAGRRRTLRTIANHRSPGLAGARNAGALTGTGELLAFLDDDDEWLPGKLLRQVELLRAEGTEAVACGIFICRNGRDIPRPGKRRVTHRDLLRSRHMEVNPCTILVRRSTFLTDIGLVDEDIPGSYCEDYEFLLRVAQRSDIPAVDHPLVRIHWHGSSYFQKRWETIARAYEYLLDKHPAVTGDERGHARIAGQIALAHAAAGKTPQARRWGRRALALDPREPRSYLAMLVAARVIRADTLMRAANSIGRGL